MKKMFLAVIVAVSCFTNVARADNPADATYFHRAFNAKYVKYNCLPNGGRVFFLNSPLDSKLNLGYTRFATKDGSITSDELTLSGKVGNLDLGLDSTVVSPGRVAYTTLGANLSNGFGSLDAVLPVDNNTDAKVGGSLKVAKNATLYLATTPGHQHSTLAGITISRKGVSLDLAGNTDRGGISSLHLSTSMKSSLGTLCPHLTVDLDTGKIGGYLGLLF